jgi:hypothetical protein
MLLQHTRDRLTEVGLQSCTGADPTGRVTIEECSKALEELARGKRPGPDGLPAEFYRALWPVIGEALVAVFNEAFDDTSPEPLLAPSMREGNTVLLYKGEGERALPSNYRPITLLNSDYKILAKAMANRVAPALADVVHPTQTAFVPGRWIGENILAHLDELDVLSSTPAPSALVFTDFSKAYDTLDRGWLRRCLTTLGLPPAYCRWADLLMAGNRNRLVVNGWLSDPFPLRGG